MATLSTHQTTLVVTLNQTVGEQQIGKDTGGDQNHMGPGMSAALALENCRKTGTTAEVQLTQREPVSSHQATCQPIGGCDIRDEQVRDPAVKEIKDFLTSRVL